jgi:hypothetical protein
MARAPIPLTVLKPLGFGRLAAAVGASVQVNLRSGGAATVYNAGTAGLVLSNPLTSDAQGRVTGWVERGAYNLVASHPDLPGGGYTAFFDAAPGGNATIDELWLPDGVVTGAKLAAAIKDAAAGVSSTRKLGTGATDAAAGDHSHSGEFVQVIDAKGDLLAGTADNIAARRSVGTNGQLLVTDLAQPTGLAWADTPPKVKDLSSLLIPSGQIAETLPRLSYLVGVQTNSGTMGETVIPLAAGDVINSVILNTGDTVGTMANHWCALMDMSRNVLGKTNDLGTAAWGAGANRVFTFTSPITITVDGLYYLGIVMVYTGTHHIRGATTGTSLSGRTPIMGATSNTGLTNPASLGATAAAQAPFGRHYYAALLG